ncbi:MAG: hypothetical protein ACE5F6_16165, partial [Anaerolineae bacterium]
MRLIILIRLAAFLFLGLCTALVGQAVSAADYTLLTTLRFDWAQEKTAQELTVASRDGTVQMTFQPNGVLSRLALDGKIALGISRPVLALRDNTHDLTSVVNLVPNPGFEQGLDGWSVDGPSQVAVGSEARTGTRSLQLGEFSGTTRVLSSRLSVDDGKSYVLSLFLKTSYGFLIDVNAAYVIWYDDSGDELSVSNPLRLYGSSHEWMRFSSRLSPPPGATQAAVLIRYARNSQYPATTPISSPPTQTLWIDDVYLYETPASMRPETLRGTLTDVGNGALRLTGASSGGIEVTATFTPEEHDVRVDVSLFAADGAPRAVDLLFSVPVTGTEPLAWEEHPRSRKPVEAGARYENTVEGVQKTDQAISNYPFSSVSAPSFGLSLGTNMARPALFKGFFDAQDNSLNLQYYLGLSPLPEKFPNQASVSLIVFAHDPLWGFRSAADIYTEEIFPSYFHGVAAGQEPIGNGPNGPLQFQQNINDWQNFGFVGNARLAPWKYSLTHDDWVQLIQQNDADNILNTLYSVPSEDFMYRDAFGAMSQTPQPSYDLFQGWLTHDALAGNYDAVATLNSGTRASNGDYLIRSIGSVSHENDKWTIDVRRDPDEGLNEGQPCDVTRCTQNQLTRREVLADMQGFIDDDAIVDGIFLDNFQIAGMLDFEPTHLRYADYPLTYDFNTFQPALST